LYAARVVCVFKPDWGWFVDIYVNKIPTSELCNSFDAGRNMRD